MYEAQESVGFETVGNGKVGLEVKEAGYLVPSGSGVTKDIKLSSAILQSLRPVSKHQH